MSSNSEHTARRLERAKNSARPIFHFALPIFPGKKIGLPENGSERIINQEISFRALLRPLLRPFEIPPPTKHGSLVAMVNSISDGKMAGKKDIFFRGKIAGSDGTQNREVRAATEHSCSGRDKTIGIS